MTKEELEKEANKYADNYATPDLDCSFRAYMFDASKEGYLASAEPREKRIEELEAQIEKMKKYIKACWVEENLNDYSSYITNTSDEFRDLVKELNDEVRNGR